MGRNALDRESRDAQTCVRSGQISRGRLSVPRQWQCHQNTGSRVRPTPLRGGWDCPRSLVLRVCRGLLGWGTPRHSCRGRQGARTSISTGTLAILSDSWFVSRSAAGSARFAAKWLGTLDWWLVPPPTRPQTYR